MSHHAASGAATRRLKKQSENHIQHHRRCAPLSTIRSTGVFSLLVVLVLVSLLAPVAAIPHGDRRPRATPLPAILVDNSYPLPPLMPPARDGAATRTSSAPLSKKSLSLDPKASDGDFQIPTPFDTGLPKNFTSGCNDFLDNMLKSDTLSTCHPFSMLLLTSSGLFDASRSKIRITQTLEATCKANSTQCLGGMNDLARELMAPAACKTDYDNNNAQVVQAYNGLIAYEPLYRASCLRDDDSNFCYANAVTNTTNSGMDAYPYSLPLGVTLAGGARPTCNSCLQDTMAIFSTFAGNKSQPISQTYGGAAQQMTIYCGTTFVNVTAAPLKGAASATTTALTPTLTLFIMFILYFFQ